MAGTQQREGSSGKGKVYVTIHKMGTDDRIEFEDGATVDHLVRAVAESDELVLSISGTKQDVRDLPQGQRIRDGMEVDAAPRRGSHG